MPTLVAVGQITITDVNDAAQLQLSAQTVSLPADASGAVTSFTAATTTARVMQGGADVTSSWTLSKADTSCTSSLASGVVTVSAMSADSAYVDVTATRAGWPTLTARFALSKAKAGANGQRVGLLEVYQWAASAPTTYPSGTSTYTWATGAFTAPTTSAGWSLTPGAAAPGQTLWGISVSVSDNLTTATSIATWNSFTVYAVGVAGRDGTNLCDASTWAAGQAGATMPWLRGDTDAGEDAIILAAGPSGAGTLLWRAVASGDSVATPSYDGGWSESRPGSGGRARIDPTKKYRHVVPVMRPSAATASGWFRAGPSPLSPVSICTLNTSTTNAVTYWHNVATSLLPADVWCLAVGVIYPAGSTGMGHTETVIIRCDTGATIATGTSWCWASTATEFSSRVFQYDAAAAGAELRFAPPWLHVVDGTEPGVQSLLGPDAWRGATGAAAVVAVLSNEAHSLPAAADGTVSSYTASGTTIQVYEGATGLTYDGVGTSNGTWKIATTATNITVGTITDSGAFVTVGQHSGVAAGTDTASITYTITGKSSGGAAISLTKTQTFSKSKQGAAGATGATGATGASAISIVLSNAAHVVPADSAGTVTSWAGASTTPKIYLGAADDTANWTLSKADTSCTSTLASGVVTVSALAADVGYVDITATRSGYATQTARFSVSKAKAGSTGAAGATGATGPAGAAGISSAVVYLYQRAASAPAVPSVTLTYTFATNALSGTLGAWTTAVPAGSNPLYVTVATAASSGASDTIGSAEWATPVILAQDGAPGATGAAGAAGANTATIYLYQRTATNVAPALPSASVTYTFATGAATGLTNGWTQTLPTTGGAYRWVITATALSTGATDTIGTGEWAAAALLAQDGAAGAPAAYVRVQSDNYSANLAGYSAHAVTVSGTVLPITWSTGHTLVVLSPSGTVDSTTNYNTYASGTAGLVAALNAVPDGKIVALAGYDAGSCDAALRAALVAFGSGLSSTWAPARVSHAFVGQRGLAAGCAYESVSSAANASGLVSVAAYFTAAGITANGATGAAGANATAYWLARSVAAVSKSVAGVYTPTSVTFSAYSATGSNAPAAYAGRFVIATSTDGSTYTDQYTSAANESSKAYTVPAGIKTMRVRLYLAGGTTTLLDEEVVPVVADGSTGATGATGAAGADATVRWVAKSAGAIALDVAGLYSPASLTFSAYSQTGTAAPAAYAGRFIIATSTDRGVTWTSQYTSAANESSTSYAPPAGVQLIRCRLYLAGGTTTLLDEEAVPVVEDGRGLNLIDSSWWAPGAAFKWDKADNAPATETTIAWATGPRGDMVPVVRAVADAVNKVATPSAVVPLELWHESELTLSAGTTFTVNTLIYDTSPSCFELTKPSLTSTSRGIASRAVAVTPGQVWRIRARVRGSTATSTGFYMRVNQAATMPSSGAVNSTNRSGYVDVVSNGAITASFATYQNLTYTVPAGVYAISLSFFSHYNVSPAANGPLTLYVDEPTVNLASGPDSVTGPRTSHDGGWLSSYPVSVDPSKTYRFAVPVKKVAGLAGRGYAYWGPATVMYNLTTDTQNTNPYFVGTSSLPLNEWHWLIGYVFPAGSSGLDSVSAGAFSAVSGDKTVGGTSYRWAPSTTSVNHRAFQFAADIDGEYLFGQPMLHVVDGSEPSLASLTSSSALMNAQQQWSDVQAVPFTSLGGDADSTSMGFNGSFLAWPAAQQYPTGWGVWTAGAITRDTSTVREADGTPSLKMVAAGGNLGIQREVSFAAPLPAGSLLWGSIDCYIAAGNTGAPTLLVRLATSAGFATFIDTVVRPSATVTGGWQRLNWTARTANLTDQIYGVRCYLMGSYSGGGYAFTGTCYFENLFFEVVDKSIDNRSMQFSEVAGALSFTPSGNGTSSFTAVTANNKVTSGNVESYIQQGAITSLGIAANTHSSISLAGLSSYSSPAIRNAATITLPAANTPMLVNGKHVLSLGVFGTNVASVLFSANVYIDGVPVSAVYSSVYHATVPVNYSGTAGRELQAQIPINLLSTTLAAGAHTIEVAWSLSMWDSAGNPATVSTGTANLTFLSVVSTNMA